MPAPTPAAQLKSFLAKYTPAIHAEMKAAHAKMRQLVPGAMEMVYDNWNGLVVGFSPTERASEAVLSIIALPDHVTLCFLFGKKLPDPDKLLKGGGTRVRHCRLVSPADLDKRAIRKLITLAIAQADPPFDPGVKNTLVIKSISAKQRPRRPSK
jgi:uncharacterized protein DUF1801